MIEGYRSLPIALFCLITVLIGRHVYIHWTRYRLARANGCKPPVQYPRTASEGREYDREQKQAWKEGRVLKWMAAAYAKSGSATYEANTMGERGINSTDPVLNQAVASNLDDWGRLTRRGGRPFFGTSIMNVNGAAGKHKRDLVTPLFKRSELSEIENFEGFVDVMMGLLPRDGSTFDMQPLMRKLFIDASTEFIFGETLGSLRDTSGKSDEFIAALNRATAGAGKRIRTTGLDAKFYALGTWDKKWLADCKVVHDFIDERIARHRSRIDQEKSTPSRRYVLIDGMSAVYPDPVDLRFQLLGIFSLARETSPMAFSSCLFLLARNPSVWTELRKQSLARGDQPITYDWLKSLTFFRNTILETLRLRNPGPRFRREALHDVVLPRGGGPDGSSPILVPKGTSVTIDKYPTFVDPDVWGEDVMEFRPSRFEGRKLGWEFMPFNGGPRNCPAGQQVILQHTYLLVRLTREFEMIENRDPCFEYIESAQMCFESRNGCKITLHPAQSF